MAFGSCKDSGELIKNWFLNFCLSEFYFQFNFSIILIFRCVKFILKASFLKIRLLEILVRPYISLIRKYEVYGFLASKLEHFENDIQFRGNIYYTLTLRVFF